jgi:hypothetical protein
MAGCVQIVDLGGSCWLSWGNIANKLIGCVIGTVVLLIFNILKLNVNKYQSGCTYIIHTGSVGEAKNGRSTRNI